MDDFAVVINAGSSSLKFSVYRRPERDAWRLETGVSGDDPRPPSRRGDRYIAIEPVLDVLGDIHPHLPTQLRPEALVVADPLGVVGRDRRPVGGLILEDVDLAATTEVGEHGDAIE